MFMFHVCVCITFIQTVQERSFCVAPRWLIWLMFWRKCIDMMRVDHSAPACCCMQHRFGKSQCLEISLFSFFNKTLTKPNRDYFCSLIIQKWTNHKKETKTIFSSLRVPNWMFQCECSSAGPSWAILHISRSLSHLPVSHPAPHFASN